MAEEPPDAPLTSSPASSRGQNDKSPEAKAPGDCVSAPRDEVIVASTTQTGAYFSEFPSSPDFSLTMLDGDGRQILTASYEGILPPPNLLKGYDEIVPGAAQEIISWVTDETKHRHKMEETEAKHRRELEKKESDHRMRLETKGMGLGEKALGWGIFRANVGMFLAWPLVIGIVSAGTYLIYNGHDWAGLILAESGLAIVVGAFVLQKIEKFMRPDKAKEKVEEGGGDKDE